MSMIYDLAGELWHVMKADYEDALNQSITEADEACHGYLVNKAGKAEGITARDLFTGPASRAVKYATRELFDYWQTHPRITLAHFEREWLFSRGGLEEYATTANKAVA